MILYNCIKFNKLHEHFFEINRDKSCCSIDDLSRGDGKTGSTIYYNNKIHILYRFKGYREFMELSALRKINYKLSFSSDQI